MVQEAHRFLKNLHLYSPFPMPIMAAGMENRINDHIVANHSKDNSVWKTGRVGPANRFPTIANAKEERIERQALHGLINSS